MPSSRLDIPARAQEPKPGQRHGLWRAGPCASTPPPRGRMVLGLHPLARGRESTPRGLASQTGGLPLARPPCPGAAAPAWVCTGSPTPDYQSSENATRKKMQCTKKVKGGALPQRHAPGEHRMSVLCRPGGGDQGLHKDDPGSTIPQRALPNCKMYERGRPCESAFGKRNAGANTNRNI